MQREIPNFVKKGSFRKILSEHKESYEAYFRKKILEKFVLQNRILEESRLLKIGLFEGKVEDFFSEKIKYAT